MTTRRELLRLVGTTATATMLFGNRGAAAALNQARPMTRRGQQLLELQQRFVDLRFGMFPHFNMAAFQDREWGDPV